MKTTTTDVITFEPPSTTAGAPPPPKQRLLDVALGAGVAAMKFGFRRGLCYVGLVGLRAQADGYGANFDEALTDALSRLPRAEVN